MGTPRIDVTALERNRIGWWVVTLAVAALLGVVATAFTGTFVFGLFVYYATRPVHEWVDGQLSNRGVAAGVTVLVVVVPILLLVGYGASVAFRELASLAGTEAARTVVDRVVADSGALSEALRQPLVTLTELEELTRLRQGVSAVLSTAGIVGAVLLYLSLALAFAFFLMRDAPRVERWVTTNVADRGSTTYALLSGIDDDLQTVYFGNVLTVLGVTVAAVAVYNGYNLFAPQSLTVPVPTLLGLLTGLATFVPIVVGKLVYVPTVGYLSWLSLQSGESFLYPVVLLVVAVVFLDVLPQTVLRPILSGRGIHSGAVLFSYVLGVAYFGWYGLFLGPLLIVLARQLLGLVVPALLSGGSLGMGGDTDGETPG